MSKALKSKIVEELKDGFKEAPCCVLLRFEGLSVAQANDLRNHLRKNDISFTVVKDSLAKMAFDQLKMPVDEKLFAGPTAVAYGGRDPIAVPKSVSEWITRDGTEALKVKGGILEGRALTAQQVRDLASLPSRPQMLSIVLGTILAPAAMVLGLTQALQNKTAGLVDALAEKREKEGAQESASAPS
jgi:large subunit ribosomal protein L10